EHSTVSRDILGEVLERLGAEVIPLGRSEVFIPVDTEAIRDEDVSLAHHWCREYQLDSIVSADGDGDRPLVSDEHGRWLRGDIIGILCARVLGARCVVTPVSSNTAVERCGWFDRVIRTRIGSPYVIAGMQQAEHEGMSAIVGYEANGGFLQQSELTVNGHLLPALPTRDAIIVPLAILSLSEQMNCPISGLDKLLPKRYTFSDRLKDFPTENAHQLLEPMLTDDDEANLAAARALLHDAFGDIVAIDTTDGVRLTLATGNIVHIRPSGNAPELRCYTESDSEETCIRLNRRCLAFLSQWLEKHQPLIKR
ncbi:MAG: phosphomannomutase, partial [Zetaproteobacteria bacterium]